MSQSQHVSSVACLNCTNGCQGACKMQYPVARPRRGQLPLVRFCCDEGIKRGYPVRPCHPPWSPPPPPPPTHTHHHTPVTLAFTIY